MPTALIAVVAGLLALVAFASHARARLSPTGLLEQGHLASPFGPRGPEGVHAGIDIAAPRGTPIRAAHDGTIVDISPDGMRSGYGNVVIVEHPTLRGALTFYAHQDRFADGLHVGQRVSAGQRIGYVGQTHAPKTEPMGPHLHFEVLTEKKLTPAGRIIVNPDTKRVDPQPWLARLGRPLADVASPDVA